MPRITSGWPAIVLLLDGLADWPCSALHGRTPLEAARTPHLDQLARDGVNGMVYPLGPGRCPSSERAQWSYLGYDPDAFPGRAYLEALGAGIEVPAERIVTYLALRSARRDGGRLVLQNWYREAQDDQCLPLIEAIDGLTVDGFTFHLSYVERGDAICCVQGPGDAAITDSDPFSTDGPVLAVQACEEARDPQAARALATALTTYLIRCHELLEVHPINRARREAGELPLNVVVTKWTGSPAPVPSLAEQVGGPATFVASRGLYAGIARASNARFEPVEECENPGDELTQKLAIALDRCERGDAFVYVHTKAPDEAGHRRDPTHKRDVIEAVDASLGPLCDVAEAVVAVTADHGTPSWGPLLHSGDGVPLCIRSPGALVDEVSGFGERTAARGGLGTLQGSDVLPLIVHASGRARFLGSRHGAAPLVAAPTDAAALLPGSSVGA